jgi:hypothetical protein
MGMPAAVLTNFKRWVNTTFDKTGEIHRPTLVFTDEGGHTNTWTPIATNVLFSVSEGFGGQSQLEAPILERIGTRVPFFLTFAAGTDIDEADRVYETTPEARTFEVIGFPNRKVSNQAAVRIVAVEVG